MIRAKKTTAATAMPIQLERERVAPRDTTPTTRAARASTLTRQFLLTMSRAKTRGRSMARISAKLLGLSKKE